MNAPAPIRGPTGADPNKVRDAIVADAGAASAKQVKAHITAALTAQDERLIKAITEGQARTAFDAGKAAGIEIGAAEGRARRAWHLLAVALFTAGLTILATMFVYERTTMFGVAIGRGEKQNDEIARDLNQKVSPP